MGYIENLVSIDTAGRLLLNTKNNKMIALVKIAAIVTRKTMDDKKSLRFRFIIFI